MKSKSISIFLALILALACVLSACSQQPEDISEDASSNADVYEESPEASEEPDISDEISEEISNEAPQIDAQGLAEKLNTHSLKRVLDEGFIEYLSERFGMDTVLQLDEAENDYNDGIWRDIFGSSLLVLHDEYTGESENSIYKDCADPENIVLSFTGDFCLCDNWEIMRYFHENGSDISKVLNAETSDYLRNADILMVNNEFSISERGAKLPGKYYTFRASPANLNIFKHIGADIVSLANNHVFDYGADAFYDTLSYLDEWGFARVGAGVNAAEAQKPIYFVIGGIKIAFLAASSAEKHVLTPEAKEDSPGIAYMYDETQLVENTAKAEMNADFVITYVHWGTEDSDQINQNQRSVAKKLVDAGADCIVGAHPHVLQGAEMIGGVPVIYSLGDFLFDSWPVSTAIYTLTIRLDLSTSSKIIPCYECAEEKVTQIVHGERAEKLLKYLTSLSVNVEFDTDGNMNIK